jgi:anti-sigma factor RsiW
MSDARQKPGQRRPRRFGPSVRLSPGWQLPESHLLPDAIVAFVDGELSVDAHERAARHLMRCTCCAAEVEAQRQVRAAMHACDAPSVPAGLLASLYSIPNTTELSVMPDNLAVDSSGRLVAVQRPEQAARLGVSKPLGSSAPLGSDPGIGGRRGRRAVQGAGVVMSGLMLSALAFALAVEEDDEPAPNRVTPPQAVQEAARTSTTAPSSAPNVVQLGVQQR